MVPRAEAMYTKIQSYMFTCQQKAGCSASQTEDAQKRQQQKHAEHNKNHVYLCHILTRNARMTAKHWR